MRKTRSVDRVTDPAKRSHEVILSDEKETRGEAESLNLSPDRIRDGASTTTLLLNQILAKQREELHQLRGWGINE